MYQRIHAGGSQLQLELIVINHDFFDQRLHELVLFVGKKFRPQFINVAECSHDVMVDQYEIQQLGCTLLIQLKKAEAISNLSEQEKFRRETEMYVQNNIKDVTVEKLAGYWGYSTKYFQNYFHRITGTPPGAFIQKQRLCYAKMLLDSSAMKITAIATASGFAQASHFCKVFKSHYGVTPDESRQRRKF